jgi:hypothetical protein
VSTWIPCMILLKMYLCPDTENSACIIVLGVCKCSSKVYIYMYE